MDSDHPGGDAGPFDYSQLNDQQLRSAIRFAEKHLRSLQEGHVALLRAYRDEIGAMRRHLIDRLLRRIVSRAGTLSDKQQCDLRRTFERRAMSTSEIAKLVHFGSKGRTDRIDALTEIEAMALLLRLAQKS